MAVFLPSWLATLEGSGGHATFPNFRLMSSKERHYVLAGCFHLALTGLGPVYGSGNSPKCTLLQVSVNTYKKPVRQWLEIRSSFDEINSADDNQSKILPGIHKTGAWVAVNTLTISIDGRAGQHLWDAIPHLPFSNSNLRVKEYILNYLVRLHGLVFVYIQIITWLQCMINFTPRQYLHEVSQILGRI